MSSGGSAPNFNPDSAWAMQAKMNADKPAIIFEGRTQTFGETLERMYRFANGLRDLGCPPGSNIGLMSFNCPEFMEAGVGFALNGCSSVPLNYRLTAEEVQYILDNSDSIGVVAGLDFTEVVDEAAKRCPKVQFKVGIGPANKLPEGWHSFADLVEKSSADKPPPPEKKSTGTIIYTSGTTGKPKGATRGEIKGASNIVMGILAKFGGVKPTDVHLVCGPLYHSAPPVFAALTSSFGGTVVLMKKFDAENALRLIDEHKVTTSFIVPTMLDRIRHLPDNIKNKYDHSSIRQLICGAAPLSTQTKLATLDFFGDVLYEFYGATETGIVTLITPKDMRRKIRCVGQVMPGYEVKLLDDNGNEVPQGEVGEIYVKSELVIGGYYKNKDATDKSIKDGFFSVGDMGYFDEEGFLYLSDRARDMIISGGVNIYPAEIEEVLHNHPAVVETAVFGIPNEEWGEEIKAVVVVKDGESVADHELAEYCQKHLAKYKVPRSFDFVSELPRNPSGKVLKKVLRAPYWEGHEAQI